MITKIGQILDSEQFRTLSRLTPLHNGWITARCIERAVKAIHTQFLDPFAVEQFISDQRIDSSIGLGRRVGIICAGNLPLVGFADMFYSLLCGFSVLIKPSSGDPLMRAFAQLPRVTIVETIDDLSSVERLLLMGSDETCRMVERRFADKSMLLRGSMHSIAILDDALSADELELLSDDIFAYWGRGCRSVTHLYLPAGYDVASLRFAPRPTIKLWDDCYTYQKARATIMEEPFYDQGYYLLQTTWIPTTSVVGYSFYDRLSSIPLDGVQHIASRGNFGSAQSPSLNDFANKANVIDFLCR